MVVNYGLHCTFLTCNPAYCSVLDVGPLNRVAPHPATKGVVPSKLLDSTTAERRGRQTGAMSSLYSTSLSRVRRAMSLEKERGEYPECIMRSTTLSDDQTNRIWPGNTT